MVVEKFDIILERQLFAYTRKGGGQVDSWW
jgi:hypothetical protein